MNILKVLSLAQAALHKFWSLHSLSNFDYNVLIHIFQIFVVKNSTWHTFLCNIWSKCVMRESCCCTSLNGGVQPEAINRDLICRDYCILHAVLYELLRRLSLYYK